MEQYWEKHPGVIETIMQRRSVRKYLDDPISDEDLQRILLAGHYAPSASNKQSWFFVAVTNKELNNEIAKIVDDAYDEMSGLLKDREAKKNIKYAKFYAKFFAESPLGIYCVATPYESQVDVYYEMMGEAGKVYRENRASAHSGIQSVSAAIQNMLLAAWSLGIGGVWLTSPIVARDKIEKILEINEGRLIAVIAFGYPSQVLGSPNRKPLEEVSRIIR